MALTLSVPGVTLPMKKPPPESVMAVGSPTSNDAVVVHVDKDMKATNADFAAVAISVEVDVVVDDAQYGAW